MSKREGVLTRRRGHAYSCKGRGINLHKCGLRPRLALHGRVRLTEKSRTLLRRKEALICASAVMRDPKLGGIDRRYTVIHDQQRRGADPSSRSHTILHRKEGINLHECSLKEEGIGPRYTVMHNQQRRGVDPPSRSRTLRQRKESIELHKCSHVQSKRGRHRPTLHGHAQPTEERRQLAIAVTHAPTKKGRH
ncbi:hypothetical protein DFH29DRAFT_881954 [Suillus ampliporus]|nr:hypothetical protein DFH29DRAFT_881954 [Suillus ampliporus]